MAFTVNCNDRTGMYYTIAKVPLMHNVMLILSQAYARGEESTLTFADLQIILAEFISLFICKW
jgi:hypothetical protein